MTSEPAPVTPIGVPPRGELWQRIRLAESVLRQRPATADTVDVVLAILAGEGHEREH